MTSPVHHPSELELPGIARYLITSQAITRLHAPTPGEAERLQRGAPQAVQLLQQGIAPLHGAALSSTGRALIVAGRSACGKSTIAALLAQRGYGVLADDLTGLYLADGAPVALPGYAGVTLWGDAMKQLGHDPSAYQRVHPELDKYVVTPETPYTDQPVPLGAIFLLSVHNEPEVRVETVTGMQKFQIVGHNTYNTRLTDALVSKDAFFELSAALAASVPVWRIRRPRRLWTAEQIADEIESRLA